MSERNLIFLFFFKTIQPKFEEFINFTFQKEKLNCLW
jgi:hypothetical protein